METIRPPNPQIALDAIEQPAFIINSLGEAEPLNAAARARIQTGELRIRSMACADHVVVTVERQDRPLDALQAQYGLTPREAEVALLIAQHLSNFEIAVQLGISRFTVRRHVERVLDKLNVRTRRRVLAVLRKSAS